MKKILRTGVVIAAMIVIVCLFAACSDDEDGSSPEFSVYAPNIDVVYDGLPHSPIVLDVLESDTVLYCAAPSTSWVAEPPSFTSPGSHVVAIKVVRGGLTREVTVSVTIRRGVLTGITAADVTYIFDGKPHGITVLGAEAGDAVTYSLDGETFSASLAVTEVGEYTVYYRVSNEYSDHADSCRLVIVPDMRGGYFDPEAGTILISATAAEVNGNIVAVSFDSDGGTIGGKPFVAGSDKISYDGRDYRKLADDEHVYRLSCGDKTVFFAAGESVSVGVKFADGNAVISALGATVATVENVNYCDTAENYKDHTVTVVADGFVTDISLMFSRFEEQDIPEFEESVTYDGSPHSPNIEFDGELKYERDGVFTDVCPEFTEPGEYRVSVLYLRDGYLPKEAEAVLYIMPNITGVYYADSEVVVIDSDKAEINGAAVSLEAAGGAWKIDGSIVGFTTDGIVVSGKNYAKLSGERVLLFITPSGSVAVKHGKNGFVLTGESDGTTVRVTVSSGDEKLYEYSCSCAALEITWERETFEVASGKPLKEEFGYSDINSKAVTVFVFSLPIAAEGV